MLRKFVSIASKYWKTLVVVIFAFALVGVVLQGYSLAWTGFGDFTKPNSEFVRGKTLWDWMQLLIIPIFLAVGVFLLNRSERKNEREIATDHQQEAAFQSYLDRMADLLLKEKLQTTENEEVRNVGRMRTLSVLRRLDTQRKGMVLRFLAESGLITERPAFGLRLADLRGANLFATNLRGANLQGIDLRSAKLYGTDLRNANLSFAFLGHAYLRAANLSGGILEFAILHGTDLRDANLSGASLKGASLSGANLRGANLSGANLSEADLLSGADLTRADLLSGLGWGIDIKEGAATLRGADLSQANLSDADLTGAKVSNEQLAIALSLKGAIMPDGTKHN